MSTKVNVFGAGVELLKDNLPSNSDVIRHAKFVNGKLVPKLKHQVIKTVAQDVISVWRTVSSVFCDPITSKDANIVKKIGRMLERAYECEAGLRTKEWRDSFVAEAQNLFEIQHCDCDILSCEESGCTECSKGVHINCTHPAESKIPEPLLLFLRYLLCSSETFMTIVDCELIQYFITGAKETDIWILKVSLVSQVFCPLGERTDQKRSLLQRGGVKQQRELN